MPFLAAAAPVIGAVGSIAGAVSNANKGAGFQAQPGLGQAQINQGFAQSNEALKQQQDFINQLQGQNGIGNQSQAFNLAQQQATGQGPNPALAQLNQATGANTANQAALMAGQRGAGANAGLIARQAAMQGAQNQQNAAGQAATLQAQQQLAGQNLMANIAGQQVGQLQQGNQAQIQGNENLLGQGVQSVGQANAANAGIAQQNAKAQAGMMGGALNAAGPVLQQGFNSIKDAFGNSTSQQPDSAQGAAVPGMGGAAMMASGGPVSAYGQFLHKFAQGGKVPALVSPGEVYLKPDQVEKVVDKKADPIKAGEKIPGKPKHPGNDYRNDTVRKDLDEGGVVIPNKILQGPNPHWESMKFVAAHARKLKK